MLNQSIKFSLLSTCRHGIYRLAHYKPHSLQYIILMQAGVFSVMCHTGIFRLCYEHDVCLSVRNIHGLWKWAHNNRLVSSIPICKSQKDSTPMVCNHTLPLHMLHAHKGRSRAVPYVSRVQCIQLY